MATTSILDDLGHEVTGIVAPVSICMFLTVVLVRLLNPEGVSNPSAVAIAQTYYREQASLSYMNTIPRLKVQHIALLQSTTQSSEPSRLETQLAQSWREPC